MATEISKEVESLLIKDRDRYLDIGKSVEPCDRKVAEASILKLYKRMGKEAPVFAWYNSPFEACIKGSKDFDSNPSEIFSARHSVHWQSWFVHCQILKENNLLDVSESDEELLTVWDDLFKSAHWFFVFEEACLCVERPNTLKVDNEGELHNEEGPAVSYNDGHSIYSWHGTTIPAEWIEDKESLTAETALKWSNIEQRRCAAEILGWDKILDELDTKVIDDNSDPQIGMLLECIIPDSGVERFLKVKCGTGRDFVLPVPPDMSSALQANAWTYGLDSDEYKPEVRT